VSPDGRAFAVRVLRSAQAPLAEQGSFAFAESGGAIQLARPQAEEQYDSAVTVTALATFADCPRRYYLAHGLGWEQRRPVRLAEWDDDFEQPSTSASELGREVHRLLAGEVFGASALAEQLAQRFRQHPLSERAMAAARVEREWSFNFAVDDVVVSGQIDLWFVEGDGIVLVDYKTNDIEPEEADEAAVAYAAQIHLYALCLERATGLRVTEAYLHFLRPDALITVEPNPEQAIRLVHDLATAQEQCRFPLVVATRCRRCAFYKNLCPADLTAPPLVGIR